MRPASVTLLLLGSLAALAVAPNASAEVDCGTTDLCVGLCALRGEACRNDGDSGYNLCVFTGAPVLSPCLRYVDCPRGLGCHPYFGVGVEAFCDLRQLGEPDCTTRVNSPLT